MVASTCVECGGNITLPDGLMTNEILHCPECGVEFEIVSLEPLTLELAPEVEEDWGE